MEQIRSFIAIELPEGLKSALAWLEAQLKSHQPPPVKWADPHSIHLTLKFLGNIDASRVGDITRAMEAAVQGIPPFPLEVRGLGAFPDIKRVQVVWVGVGGEVDRLARLQQRLESNLAPLGFTPEARPFAPHLTIARLREASRDERQSFGQVIASTGFEPACDFAVDSVNLMRSQLTREGPIYSRLSLAKLREP